MKLRIMQVEIISDEAKQIPIYEYLYGCKGKAHPMDNGCFASGCYPEICNIIDDSLLTGNGFFESD